jgi:hypothetical protein
MAIYRYFGNIRHIRWMNQIKCDGRYKKIVDAVYLGMLLIASCLAKEDYFCDPAGQHTEE